MYQQCFISPHSSSTSVHQWLIPPTQSHHLSKHFADRSGPGNNRCEGDAVNNIKWTWEFLPPPPHRHRTYWKSMSIIMETYCYSQCILYRVQISWPSVRNVSDSLWMNLNLFATVYSGWKMITGHILLYFVWFYFRNRKLWKPFWKFEWGLKKKTTRHTNILYLTRVLEISTSLSHKAAGFTGSWTGKSL